MLNDNIYNQRPIYVPSALCVDYSAKHLGVRSFSSNAKDNGMGLQSVKMNFSDEMSAAFEALYDNDVVGNKQLIKCLSELANPYDPQSAERHEDSIIDCGVGVSLMPWANYASLNPIIGRVQELLGVDSGVGFGTFLSAKLIPQQTEFSEWTDAAIERCQEPIGIPIFFVPNLDVPYLCLGIDAIKAFGLSIDFGDKSIVDISKQERKPSFAPKQKAMQFETKIIN